MNSLCTFGLTLLVVSAAAKPQRYQGDEPSYLSDIYGDYEGDRGAQPTPRSYSPAAAAPQRPAPAGPKPTPVAILKQINRHNEDGSYTYGFEGADGSFKIETKLANGEVKGKYGFVDDGGKVRVVEYGADQYGFQPSGEGITVAPPTLVDETTSKEALEAQKYQDYQDYNQPIARPAPRPQPIARPQTATYQYQPQYPTQQQAAAIYAAQQVRLAPKAAQPIFTPALEQQRHQPRLGLQSQLIQSPYYLGEEQQQYKSGPVQFGPAPVQEHHLQAQARAQPQARSGAGGLLDQLARDYALPADSAAPLHDISFGYY